MQFSKIKRNAEAFLAPSLQGRVHIYSAVYRKYHDQPTRTWLTFDGQQILSASDLQFERLENRLYNERKATLGERPDWSAFLRRFSTLPYYVASQQLYETIDAELYAQGVFNSYAVQQALIRYNELSIAQALTHDNPFVRGYALLDGRVGKRTLQKFETFDTLFEARCYTIRLRAEEEFRGKASSATRVTK